MIHGRATHTGSPIMRNPTTRRLAPSLLLLAVATAGCAALGEWPAQPAALVPVPLGDSAAEGSADAWVTVVEFTDLQCFHCARAQATLRRLRERHGEGVRVVVKHDPVELHPDALPAAIAAECARAQGAFWPYERLLFERQAELGEDRYPEWAREVPGIDVERFRSCVALREPARRIEDDRALAARLGVSATPTFFVNGRRVVGARRLERVVEEELARARASGLPPRGYYERTVLGGVAR